MSKPKVSVIIPVFNTELYVCQAVSSILNQTLKDIEIIIINDGSTDNSLNILEKLASKDNRIQIQSQINQGQSIARNNAIKIASGEYVYFMDSDDILDKCALEECYAKCIQNNLDFVIFDGEILNNDYSYSIDLKYARAEHTNENKVYTGCELFNQLLTNYVYSASPCLSFIKTSYLKKKELYFYPGIIHEDELFTALLYLQANRIMSIHQAYFKRRFRPDSTMTKGFTKKNMKGYFTVADQLILFKQGQTTEIATLIDRFLTLMLNAAVWKAFMLSKRKRIKVFFICIFKYNQYIKAKTLLTLLFKSFISK